MFPQSNVNLLCRWLDDMERDSVVTKHWNGNSFTWGDKFRRVDFKGMCHDLFTADESNWGAQLLIRTGSADYSARVVDTILKRGVYRQGGDQSPAQKGRLVEVATGRIVPTPTEEAYMRIVGLPWIRPEDRT